MLIKLKAKKSFKEKADKAIVSNIIDCDTSEISNEFNKFWKNYCKHRTGWKMPIEYCRLIAFDFFVKGSTFFRGK